MVAMDNRASPAPRFTAKGMKLNLPGWDKSPPWEKFFCSAQKQIVHCCQDFTAITCLALYVDDKENPRRLVQRPLGVIVVFGMSEVPAGGYLGLWVVQPSKPVLWSAVGQEVFVEVAVPGDDHRYHGAIDCQITCKSKFFFTVSAFEIIPN